MYDLRDLNHLLLITASSTNEEFKENVTTVNAFLVHLVILLINVLITTVQWISSSGSLL